MGTASPSLVPSRVRFGVLAFACTLALVTYLDRVCIGRVQEDIQRDLGISDKGLGVVFGAFALGYALLEIPGGWLGDRYGSRRVLAGIVVWWSVFTALSGCVWPFTPLDSGRRISLFGSEIPLLIDALFLLVLIRFLFGAGEAGAFPNVALMLKKWFPYSERARAQGFIWMSARIGGAFAPLVIGRLAVAIGWRPAFWTLGLLGVVWAVLFYWWYRDRPEDKPGCNAAEIELIRSGFHEQPVAAVLPAGADEPWRGDAPAEGIVARPEGTTNTVPPSDGIVREVSTAAPPAHEEDGHASPGWRAIVGSATVWALCLAAFGVSFSWYFFPTWQPRYLKDVYGISFQNSEILIGLPFLFGAIGSYLGGSLSDRLVRRIGRRWGRSLVGLIGFTGAGLCFVAAAFVSQAWLAIALLCLASLINDFAIPVIWAVSADVGGRFVGTVAGVMNMVGAFGAMLGPALLPQVKDALPASMSVPGRWQIILIGLGVMWLLSAVPWLFINAARPLFGSR
jgi:MFS family permease